MSERTPTREELLALRDEVAGMAVETRELVTAGAGAMTILMHGAEARAYAQVSARLSALLGEDG